MGSEEVRWRREGESWKVHFRGIYQGVYDLITVGYFQKPVRNMHLQVTPVEGKAAEIFMPSSFPVCHQLSSGRRFPAFPACQAWRDSDVLMWQKDTENRRIIEKQNRNEECLRPKNQGKIILREGRRGLHYPLLLRGPKMSISILEIVGFYSNSPLMEQWSQKVETAQWL